MSSSMFVVCLALTLIILLGVIALSFPFPPSGNELHEALYSNGWLYWCPYKSRSRCCRSCLLVKWSREDLYPRLYPSQIRDEPARRRQIRIGCLLTIVDISIIRKPDLHSCKLISCKLLCRIYGHWQDLSEALWYWRGKVDPPPL